MDVRNVVGWIVVPLALAGVLVLGAAGGIELSKGAWLWAIAYALGALVSFAALRIGWRLAGRAEVMA